MNQKYVVVAPVGDFMEALFVGIKEFPTERVILITPKDKVKEAEKAKQELEKFRIPVKIHEIKGNIWEETFMAIADIKKIEGDNILINVATGSRDTRCAATSAAFVNGLKAFATDGNEVMLLPVLKFSYYRILTEKKMDLLKILYHNKDCCASLEDLSKKAKMSLPLVSYHINGNLKSEGLKALGLIETTEAKGRITVKLTMMGKLLIKGYI